MTDAIQLASDVLLAGVPYALAFGLVRIAVRAFLSMALGGRILFSKNFLLVLRVSIDICIY